MKLWSMRVSIDDMREPREFFDNLDGRVARPRQLVMNGGTSSAATWDT